MATKATHHFFNETGSTFEIPEGFTCAHITSVSGTLTVYPSDPDGTGVQYFVAEGETLPFWKIGMPYKAITIVTPAQAESKGWYIMI